MSPVIDTHCHLGPWLMADELVSLMDAGGVDKAVVFSCPSNWSLPSADNYYHTNDYIAEAQRLHPDRLIGFACLNPQFSGDAGTGMPNLAVRELRRCVTELGLRGLKLHPEVHCFTVPSLIGSELMETVVALQGETGRTLPIICHGMTTMGAMPEHFAMLAARYPSIPIIIAHGGGFQNLYLTTIDDCHLISVAGRLGVDRVLFGTDHFARSQQNLYRNFRFVLEGAFPDPADRAKVLGGTAARLLGLG
jgi:predicted TIM-barrel fold metal-dependent hydrolase